MNSLQGQVSFTYLPAIYGQPNQAFTSASPFPSYFLTPFFFAYNFFKFPLSDSILLVKLPALTLS
jgi:hypothetical protein